MWAKQKRKSGFTIVELLIVIVVIGILAAITIVSFNGVTAKAKFAGYQSDMKNTIKFLEMYKAENGAYPLVSGFSFQGTSPTAAARNQYIPGLVPTYTSSLPISGDSNAQYVYKSNGTDYKLIRYNANGIPNSEWKLVPSEMIDTTGNSNKDRYGYWTPGGFTF